MMTFPTEWKVKKIHGSSHHQPAFDVVIEHTLLGHGQIIVQKMIYYSYATFFKTMLLGKL